MDERILHLMCPRCNGISIIRERALDGKDECMTCCAVYPSSESLYYEIHDGQITFHHNFAEPDPALIQQIDELTQEVAVRDMCIKQIFPILHGLKRNLSQEVLAICESICK